MAPRQPQAVDSNAEAKKEEKTNLGDSAGLKRRLDDAAVEVITNSGYLEDTMVSNVKIVLGVLTIAVALLAQFYPSKYPDNWLLLLVCVIVYSLLSTLLTVFTTSYEGDTILFTRPPRVGPGKVGLKVASRLPRFSDVYTLEIAEKLRNARPAASMDCSVTKYFYSDGTMAEAAFKADVEQLLDQYQAKKSS